MIKLCENKHIDVMHLIINDAATAYKGNIPDDRYHEPYMSMDELQQEIEDGVVFFGYFDDKNELVGVMGTQDKGEVSLIRHAYVRTKVRNSGIGSKLLHHIVAQTTKPILIGTWQSVQWAIKFYEKNGFSLTSLGQKDKLLRKFWNIPERQIATSVVLYDRQLAKDFVQAYS